MDDSFVNEETAESRKERKDPDWEPSWIKKRFSFILVCPNKRCQEKVFVSGEGTVSDDFFYDDKKQKEIEVITEHLRPLYINPRLKIIEEHDETPFEVCEAIQRANALYWADKGACCNAIRKVVEAILSDKRIAKTAPTKKNTKRKINLHDRIELFEKKNKVVAETLMAIKWVGNIGSHDDEIDNEELLDGIELLNRALEKLYYDHDKRLDSLTKKINKRRRP